MASKTINFLESCESEPPSHFTEEAAWHKEIVRWLSRAHIFTLSTLAMLSSF